MQLCSRHRTAWQTRAHPAASAVGLLPGQGGVPGVPDPASWAVCVAPRLPWLPWLPLPTGYKAQLTEPLDPEAPPLPDHEKAPAGSVVSQGRGHNTHILMPSEWDTDAQVAITAQ